jgi:hypothetical protein
MRPSWQWLRVGAAWAASAAAMLQLQRPFNGSPVALFGKMFHIGTDGIYASD